MKKHLAALAALVATTFGAFADPASGDIYEILVTNDSQGVIPSESAPLTSGQRLTIKVRLLNHDYALSTAKPWAFMPEFPPVGSYDPETSAIRPKLALLLGGDNRSGGEKYAGKIYAEYLRRDVVTVDRGGAVGETETFTDLYFQYVVKPGDLAFPANFSWIYGGAEFELVTEGWRLTNGNNASCVFSYIPNGDPRIELADPGRMEELSRPLTGKDLGIYIETVEFDPEPSNYYKVRTSPPEAEDDSIWRLFYKNDASRQAVPVTATINVKGGVVDAPSTVYVWVEDPTVADVVGAASDIEVVDGHRVLRVTIPSKGSAASFQIAGVDSSEGHNTTHIRMSSSKYRTKDNLGNETADWVERTIKVAEMPDPSVSIQIQGPEGQPLEKNTATLTAEYDKPIARIQLMIPKAPSAKMTVNLVQDLADGDIFEDGLLGVSKDPDYDTPWNDEELSVEFKPEDTVLTKVLYVYGKGTTKKFSMSGCTFTVETEGAPEYDGESGKHSARLLLKDMNPLLVKPTKGDAITDAMAGKSYSLDIAISDARKYMEGAANGDEAYEVFYRVEANGTEGEWQSDDAVYLQDADSGEATILVPFDIEGDCDLRLYVISPSGKKSTEILIPVKVSAPKRATVTLDHSSGVYGEGETAYVNIHLTQKYRSELFAFLVPQDDETREKFETDISSEGPISICYFGVNETDTKTPVEIRIKDGRTIGSYQVFMCTTKIYSKTKSAGYIGDIFTISATNVIPRITKASMNGAAAKNGKIEKAVAMGVEKTFTIDVDEPGLVDLDSTTDKFLTQWNFGDGWTDPNNQMWGNPKLSTTSIKHTFTSPGVQTVLVRCQDKDMRAAGKWSDEYEFTVTVLEMPKVEIRSMSGVKSFYEDQTGEQSSFEVTLSTPPDIASGASEKLRVDLTVEPVNKDSAAGYTKDDCQLSRDFVEFGGGDTNARTFTLRKLDGSAGSAAYGFKIVAKVKNPEIDTEGKTWEDGEIEITVLNRDPVINSPAERLNKDGEPIVSNAKLGIDYPITWAINDVMGDRKGMTVTWETNDGDTKTYQQGAGYDDVMSGTHTFKFNSSGDKTLTLTVTDKDGGFASRTFHYTIEASKSIVVTAHGPAAATASNNGLSTSYGVAPGLGAGRVDAADGRNPTKTTEWMSSFTVGVSDSDLLMTARGYTVGDVNNMLDVNGTYPKGGANYSYNDQAGLGAEGFDSFLYAWIYNNIAKENVAGDKDIIFVMAKKGNAALPLPMDSSGDDKGNAKSFATQYWEALFSRECYASDNCGDLNLDGIPDVYALRYAPDIFEWRTQALVGNDLKDISESNIDDDYLPNTETASMAHFIPRLSNTWVTIGRAFTMHDEIRGYGKHLNDATAAKFPDGAENKVPVAGVTPAKKYADPDQDPDSTLTVLEWWAFTNYCATANLEVTDPASWNKWSPERPTRPDEADTDGDGMPDGYEYYFWYKAHVGWFEEQTKDGVTTTNLLQFTGRKYNPLNPSEPTIISAKDIEKLYDPITKNAFSSDTDTDNDGLTDLIEFEIGTNPLDYDTDNDGIPDGWEVTMSTKDHSLDPLNPDDAGANADKDQMAFLDVTGVYEATVVYTNDKDRVEHKLYILPKKGVTRPPTLLDDPDPAEGEEAFKIFDTTERWTIVEAFKYNNDGMLVLTKYLTNEKMSPDDRDYAKALQNIRVKRMPIDADHLVTLRLIHRDVLLRLGFHPWTAWNANLGSIYRINTAPFTAYDEFMLLAYFYQKGGIAKNDVENIKPDRLLNAWKKFTTSPFSADTDEDGMPDGWELYIQQSDSPTDGYGALYNFGKLGTGFEQDPDQDWDPELLKFFTVRMEYDGVDSCGCYAGALGAEKIVNGRPEWHNKKWPTDPFNADTDGDGIMDGREYEYRGKTFIFDSSCYDPITEHPTAVTGGGLNPHSWDTDLDGLPDPWEYEFSGTVIAKVTELTTETATATTTDGGNTNEVSTTTTVPVTTLGVFDKRGMDPTYHDASFDYDSDGLKNWQEYMVGAMRCWRYDDTTSPWNVHKTTASDPQNIFMADDESIWQAMFEPWHVYKPEGEQTFRLIERTKAYNPGFANGYFDPRAAYFSCCRNDFDHAHGYWYMLKDGLYHDLAGVEYTDGTRPSAGQIDIGTIDDVKSYNRWTAMYAAAGIDEGYGFHAVDSNGVLIYPLMYICCNPLNADSDGDGMDDYYELFHGLNPLLGAAGSEAEGPRDLVYIAWGGSSVGAPHALANYWITKDGGTWTMLHTTDPSELTAGQDELTVLNNPIAVKNDELSAMDFYHFPWLTGLPEADVDGDNIRNQHESILPNPQAAPTFQHLDPSPLWLTDPDYERSLTCRFYNITTPGWAGEGVWPVTRTSPFIKHGDQIISLAECPWLIYTEFTQEYVLSSSINSLLNRIDSMFDYEANEGYDSDHDYLSDFEESQSRNKPASNAQRFEDPNRHQAMWFNGTDAFLQTPLPESMALPSAAADSERRQEFLYFTAEAWVKPDAEIVDKDGSFTVLERPIVSGMAGGGDETYLRRNFYIGIRNGRWYADFSTAGTDKDQSVKIENGPLATTNWTHVAVSYGPEDGNELDPTAKMALKLFVNGQCVQILNTQLQPEYGAKALCIAEMGGEFILREWGNNVNGRDLISILVGASAKTSNGICFDMAWQRRSEDVTSAFPKPVPNTAAQTTLDDYCNFFKGYIDEVRIWDGVRPDDDIKNDYDNRVRYTTELVERNRKEVYEAWSQGARRLMHIPRDGEGKLLPPGGKLPAEIRYHWAFDHVAGAVDQENVIPAPVGFETAGAVTDAMAIWARPEGWTSRWLDSISPDIVSSIYTDHAWVPWINNTVAHVRNMDGSTFDSMFWTEKFCGKSSCTNFGYAVFAFPRTAEVASHLHQQRELETGISESTRYEIIVGTPSQPALGDYEDFEKFRYTRRNYLNIGSDLLPFGGAYPKRISTTEGGMWDDGLAADAWVETGADADNNGLPDWWENYARRNLATGVKPWEALNRNSTIVYDGAEMPLYRAYLHDIARGMQPNGKYDDDFVDYRDADNDGLPDWWENMYDINTNSELDGRLDTDGDGLSNLAEYRIGEIYRYFLCNPKLAMTDGVCVDYFRRIGNLYLGEIFSDHDLVNDLWEDENMQSVPGTANEFFASRAIFDPLADADEDGWSNYAEYRANTSPSTSQALSIDGYVCPEYPVPIIEANVVYNGQYSIKGPLVFKAWSQRTDPDMVHVPAATWTLGSVEEAAATEGSTSANSSNTRGSELQKFEKFIGRKPKGEYTFYMTGGNVSEGSVKLLYLDKGFGYQYYNGTTGQFTTAGIGDPDEAIWYERITDRNGQLLVFGSSVREDASVVGTIDYKTGKVTINFDHNELVGYRRGEVPDAEVAEDGSTIVALNNLDNAYWRVEWMSSQNMMLSPGIHYFSEADTGHLVEGLHSFVCFADEDGDGEYTAGELLGFVRDVDVGWSSAKFTIELTETCPIFGRASLLDGSNDRAVWFGEDSGNVSEMFYQGAGSTSSDETSTISSVAADTSLSGGKQQRVRIDRFAVNGMPIGVVTNTINVKDRVIVDKNFDLAARSFIFEGDILGHDVFDIDWKNFKEIADDPVLKIYFKEVNSVTYRIVIDNEDVVHPALSNRVLNVAFTRWFDSTGSRQVPTNLTDIVSYGARPTFRWSMKDKNGLTHNSYTAFKLQILKGNELIYTSPMTRAPAMDKNENYVWTAPFCIGDQTPEGKLLACAGEYEWRVSMYNAKFQTDAYSQPAKLLVSVNQYSEFDDYGYGTIKAAVKYAGPSEVLSKADDLSQVAGKVRVQAFPTPDFSDLPYAQTVVTNCTAIADVSNHTANVTLAGLPEGHYYVRAYIDTNGNFQKDDWESWGYARSTAKVTKTAAIPFVEVYIEDADTDGDWIPDAWEYVTLGSLTKLNPCLECIDAGGRVVVIERTYNPPRVAAMSQVDTADAFFQNFNTARVMCSNLANAPDPSTDTVQYLQNVLGKKIEPETVKITALEIDAENREVVMTVGGEVTDSTIFLPYSLTGPTKVTVSVYEKSSLAVKEWSWVKDVEVEIVNRLNQRIEVPIGDVDFSSGFFKIEVVQ